MISIITITYNNLDELKRTLNSLPARSEIESIIINGGDDPHVVEYLRNYDGLVVNEKDAGIANAFNKGLKLASGDSIMFLNSGDVLINRAYLNNAKKILMDNNVQFVHSNLLFVDDHGGKIVMKPPMKNPGRGMPFLHPTMIVKKNVFEEVGGFNESYKISMDFEFVLRLLKLNYKSFYVDSVPVVEMDGKGSSVVNEYAAIKECRRALIENDNYSLQTKVNLLVRLVLYFFRILLIKTGGSKLLGILKRLKHNN